jgi:hypothetical protein
MDVDEPHRASCKEAHRARREEARSICCKEALHLFREKARGKTGHPKDNP